MSNGDDNLILLGEDYLKKKEESELSQDEVDSVLVDGTSSGETGESEPVESEVEYPEYSFIYNPTGDESNTEFNYDVYYTDSGEPRMGYLDVGTSKRNYNTKYPEYFIDDIWWEDLRDGTKYFADKTGFEEGPYKGIIKPSQEYLDNVPSEHRSETLYSETYQEELNKYQQSIKEEDFIRYLDLLGDDVFFTLGEAFPEGFYWAGGKDSPIQNHAGYKKDLFEEYFNNKLNERGLSLIEKDKETLLNQDVSSEDANDAQFEEAYQLATSLMSPKELEILELLDSLESAGAIEKKKINKRLIELRGEITKMYDPDNPEANKFIDQDWYTDEDAKNSENMLDAFDAGLKNNEITVSDLEQLWYSAANKLLALNEIYENYPGVIKRDGNSITAKDATSGLFSESDIAKQLEISTKFLPKETLAYPAFALFTKFIDSRQTHTKRLDGYNEFMNYRKKLTIELQVLSRALLLNQDPTADTGGAKRKFSFFKQLVN